MGNICQKPKIKKKLKTTWKIWSQMPGIQWDHGKNKGLVVSRRYGSISWVIAVHRNAREKGHSKSGDDDSMCIEFRKKQKDTVPAEN